MSKRTPASVVTYSPRALLVLALVSLIGLAMYGWPLLASAESEVAHSADAPIIFAVILGMLIFVVLAEVASGGLDAKALAVLGVLSALAAVLRPFGAGMSGFQPMFVVLIIGGRVLGPGFGFALGLVSMLGSALLTGGVGPWLPFQMLGAAWLGMGAGLLPSYRGKAEVTLLAAYAAVSGILYGFLLNLWFWPFVTSTDTAISFVPGDPVLENLGRFFVYCLITSLGFDIPRAIGLVVIIALAGGPLLRTLRRTTRKANFAAAVHFEPGRAASTARVSPTSHDQAAKPH
ncbi:MAG: ECF transporter S component [Actinomycetia bacterium]|nr:ECF transporter S component [Actinomycetes bacterium]